MLCEKHDNTMSERPTPETDTLDRELHNPKVLSDRYSIMRDHSNNLERQRNNLQDQRDFAMGEIERLKEERDEAREVGWKAAMQAVWDRLPIPEYANDPMTPREVAKLIEFVRSQKEAAK